MVTKGIARRAQRESEIPGTWSGAGQLTADHQVINWRVLIAGTLPHRAGPAGRYSGMRDPEQGLASGTVGELVVAFW